MTTKVKWTAIVLTCAKREWGEALQKGKICHNRWFDFIISI